MPETTQQQANVVTLKAAMLEYVMPVILALLGFMGIQVLDQVKEVQADNKRQDRELTEVQSTVDYLERELTRVRDREE